jgi:integrase
LQLQRKAETLRKGWGTVPEWVFISESGKPLILNHWRKGVFDRALGKAKLRKIRILDLRHSYASMLIQAGESLAYIRDQIGHHSIKVTVDIYAHLAPEANKKAVVRLDDTATGRNPDAPKKEKELTQNANSLKLLASPTGFEPVLPA